MLVEKPNSADFPSDACASHNVFFPQGVSSTLHWWQGFFYFIEAQSKQGVRIMMIALICGWTRPHLSPSSSRLSIINVFADFSKHHSLSSDSHVT